VTSGEIVTEVAFSWGCAWGDYDQNGFLDLFVGNNGINSLFNGNGDGTFTKVLEEPFLTDAGNSRGGSWGDYDNDGNLDLFVPNNGTDDFLYHNDGFASGFSFTKITDDTIANDGTDSRGSSWVDYDQDGFIDMFVARVGDDFLYRNNGDGSFAKVDTGIIVNDGLFSIGPSWCNFDNDGDPDLFVANFFSNGNRLYRNNGNGWFTRDTTSPAGTDAGDCSAGSWGDYDNDGDFDLFVANTAGTNLLYTNNGPPDHAFTKVTSGPIATDAGTSYGSTWADFDNDGDLDLFVANIGINFYYQNNGPPDYSFTKITGINITTDGGNSYGSCVGDIDNDGDLDLFIANSGANFLYLNDGNGNGWINILCEGKVSNVSAIGTRVLALATFNGSSIWQMQEVMGQTAYYSQSSMNVEFGFGNASMIDSIVIEWPSGTVDRYGPTPVNEFFTATEGAGIVVGVEQGGSSLPENSVLLQNYPNPFNPETMISFRLSRESSVKLTVSNILGEVVDVVLEDIKPAGFYEVRWNGANQVGNQVSAGIYFYHLRGEPAEADGRESIIRKMILLR